MFRFTIRDMLWLMVVVGLGIGWRLHYESSTALEQRAARPPDPSWFTDDPDYPAKYRRKSQLLDECATENEQLRKELNQLGGKIESPQVIQLYPSKDKRP